MHRSRTKGSCETARWKERPEQSGQRRGIVEGGRPKENWERRKGRERKDERTIEFKSIGKIRDDETWQKGPGPKIGRYIGWRGGEVEINFELNYPRWICLFASVRLLLIFTSVT